MILGNFKELNHHIKMCHCNNYRKLHGKPVKRWRQIYRAEVKKWKRLRKLYEQPVMIGNYEFTPDGNGGVYFKYVGESEN